ncbi:thiamine biosynthesis lipoprotein ApbE precursor [bacterium BMS3Bbin04]|nr:thiamine biosynthesis lipoprotein ApbE precursor [bacterium BMS3Bbin04]
MKTSSKLSGHFGVSMLAALIFISGCSQLPVEDTKTLMGTQVIVTIYDYDKEQINSDQLQSVLDSSFREIKRIQSLAQWRQLKNLNDWAGKRPAYIGNELITLIDDAYLLSVDTHGAFRPDMGPLVKLWAIGTDSARIPAYWEIEDAQDVVFDTYFNVVDSATAYLEPLGASLDLGGVAKGYAVDRACEVLKELGVTAGMVWAGGDLKVFGHKPDGEPWRIAVRHPRDPEQFAAVLEIRDEMAVATSGDYERYFEINGGRYHHIINPETGYPGLKSISATVLAERCMDADAYATAFFVLGPEEGIRMSSQFDLPAMIMAERDGEIVMKETSSFRRLRGDLDAVVEQ